MSQEIYKKQVELLLKVLPEVAKEDNFALHGGTAINLFIRNMPRLSVDLDLTYIPIMPRTKTLEDISTALKEIQKNISKVLPKAQIEHKENIGKLIISLLGTKIKIEVNLVGRGLITEPKKHVLCQKAQKDYDAFAAIKIVPLGQLYGGKICAALDRQHPRDLFDVQYLLENEGFSAEIKAGFILNLISSDRPIHEMLTPNFLNQRKTMENQFIGMTNYSFTYDDFEETRKRLIKIVNNSLTPIDKDFLLSIKKLVPNWSIYDFQKFPAVLWKLQNIEKLKRSNPGKYQKQCSLLEKRLESRIDQAESS